MLEFAVDDATPERTHRIVALQSFREMRRVGDQEVDRERNAVRREPQGPLQVIPRRREDEGTLVPSQRDDPELPCLPPRITRSEPRPAPLGSVTLPLG